jgi:hypothetical protein
VTSVGKGSRQPDLTRVNFEVSNPIHLELLKQGVVVWNAWRRRNTGVKPDLSRTDLRRTKLILSDLMEADLSGADLGGANLSCVNLKGADFRGANLDDANLSRADVSGANLTGANLNWANISVYGSTAATVVCELIRSGLKLVNLVARSQPGQAEFSSRSGRIDTSSPGNRHFKVLHKLLHKPTTTTSKNAPERPESTYI